MSQQINLFNPALLKQKPFLTSQTMLVALGVLLAGCAAVSVYARHSVKELEADVVAGTELLNKKKLRHATALAEFAPRQKTKELEAQIAEAQADLRAMQNIEVILRRGELGDTTGYAEYFKALARQSNGQLWLTGVTINGAGQQIGLQGRAVNPDLVPAYIGRLTREPVLQGKSFGSLSIQRGQLKDAGGAPGASVATAPTPAADAPFVEFSLQAEGIKADEGRAVPNVASEAAIFKRIGDSIK